jgi:hypothetical protein
MNRFKNFMKTACLWGIVLNMFVFSFAALNSMLELQLLSLVNIALLLVHFVVE